MTTSAYSQVHRTDPLKAYPSDHNFYNDSGDDSGDDIGIDSIGYKQRLLVDDGSLASGDL